MALSAEERQSMMNAKQNQVRHLVGKPILNDLQ